MARQDKFETTIREKLSGFDVSYDPSLWIGIEAKLNRQSRLKKIKKIGVVSSVLFFAVIGGIGLLSRDSENGISISKEVEKSVSNSTLFSINPVLPTNSEIPTINSVQKESEAIVTPTVKEENSTAELSGKTILPIKNEKPVYESIIASSIQERTSINSLETLSNITFSVSKTSVCQNEEIQFSVINSSANYAYVWHFGNNQSREGRTVKYKFEQHGTYSVNLVARNAVGNTIESTQKESILVHPNPESRFKSRSNAENGLANASVSFESEEDALSSHQWTFGDGNESREMNPSHLFLRRGVYSVSLETKNDQNCTSKTTQRISVLEDYNLLAPDAFSPNGDGRNDTWLPVALKYNDFTFTLSIMDKAGTQVFSTSTKNNEWNGWLQEKGRVAEFGETFVWIAKVNEPSGIEQGYRGTITIIK